MLRLFICFIAISFSTLSVADNALASISERISKPALLSGHFEQQKKLAILAMPLVSTGHFFVWQQQGVLWQLEQPIQSTLIISDSGIKGADITDDRALRYIGKLLNQLLSGDISVLEQQFVVDVVENTQEQWQLNLTPRSVLLQKAITHIQLSGDRYIRSLLLQEKSDDSTQITFSTLVEHDKPSDEVQHAFAAP